MQLVFKHCKIYIQSTVIKVHTSKLTLSSGMLCIRGTDACVGDDGSDCSS